MLTHAHTTHSIDNQTQKTPPHPPYFQRHTDSRKRVPSKPNPLNHFQTPKKWRGGTPIPLRINLLASRYWASWRFVMLTRNGGRVRSAGSWSKDWVALAGSYSRQSQVISAGNSAAPWAELCVPRPKLR
jgi:hypothetical protein